MEENRLIPIKDLSDEALIDFTNRPSNIIYCVRVNENNQADFSVSDLVMEILRQRKELSDRPTDAYHKNYVDEWNEKYIVHGQETGLEAIAAVNFNLRRYWTPDMLRSLALYFLGPEELEAIYEMRHRESEVVGVQTGGKELWEEKNPPVEKEDCNG